MTIGINDNYLASVTYRSKTFPIYIALGLLFGAVSFYFYLLAVMDPYSNEVAMLAGFVFTIFSIISIGSYFSSKRAYF